MSYYSYTILECTNPELISSASTFVKESNSKLLIIIDSKSHFVTRKDTMEREILELSKKHPEEIFNVEYHWDDDDYDRIRYTYEYKNGECKELGFKPGYLFVYPVNIILNKEHYLAFQDHRSAFQDHVIKYLERVDLVKDKDGKYKINKLIYEKDLYGYKSYLTITYENDLYKWTATRKWVTWIEVTFEKKEPLVDSMKNYEDKKIDNQIDNQDSDYSDLPF